MIEVNYMIPFIEKMYEKHGMPIDPEFNQIGIRNPADKNLDVLNDTFLLYLPSKKIIYAYPGTTDPGKNATSTKDGGAANLCEGAWPDMWVLDMHAPNIPSFKHMAFCQRPQYGCKKVKIWRDRNRNFTDDDNSYEMRNDIGLNKHRAAKHSLIKVIGDYSWACQVARNVQDHEQEVAIAQQLSSFKKNRWRTFSYLLINIDSVKSAGIQLP